MSSSLSYRQPVKLNWWRSDTVKFSSLEYNSGESVLYPLQFVEVDWRHSCIQSVAVVQAWRHYADCNRLCHVIRKTITNMSYVEVTRFADIIDCWLTTDADPVWLRDPWWLLLVWFKHRISRPLWPHPCVRAHVRQKTGPRQTWPGWEKVCYGAVIHVLWKRIVPKSPTARPY